MEDDKKMNELTDDELEQAAGGRVFGVFGPGVSLWIAQDNRDGNEKRSFKTESEAVNYAMKQGWGL